MCCKYHCMLHRAGSRSMWPWQSTSRQLPSLMPCCITACPAGLSPAIGMASSPLCMLKGQPKKVSRKWTPDEVGYLMQAIQLHANTNALINWAEIAKYVPGRTGKQCREKYKASVSIFSAHGQSALLCLQSTLAMALVAVAQLTQLTAWGPLGHLGVMPSSCIRGWTEPIAEPIVTTLTCYAE